VSEGREPASIPPWTRTEEIVRELPAEARSNAFYAVEYQVDRGEGWSDSVVAYLAAANGRVVAIDR
jgi:hypothetical protein